MDSQDKEMELLKKVIDKFDCEIVGDKQTRNAWLSCHRANMMASIDQVLKTAESGHYDYEVGQDFLFDAEERKKDPDVIAKPWTDLERLHHEKRALGLYLTGNPVDEILQKTTFDVIRIADLRRESIVLTAGEIIKFKTTYDRNGKQMAFFTLSDPPSTLRCVMFHRAFREFQDQLINADFCLVYGKYQPERKSLIVKRFKREEA